MQLHEFAKNPGNPENTFILPFVFTDKVREAVESIWKCHDPVQHRLYLIDNSSEDFKDRSWLEENCHLYIRCYRNLGPAVSYNLGIIMARTPYVTIFSDDARLINGIWYQNALRVIQDDDNLILSLGNIFPQRVPPEDFYQPDKNYSIEDYEALAFKYQSRASRDFNFATAISTKQTFIKAGLFPEDTYIYGVDAEFMREAEDKKVKTVQGSDVVFHYGDASHKGRLVEAGKYQQSGILSGRMAHL